MDVGPDQQHFKSAAMRRSRNVLLVPIEGLGRYLFNSGNRRGRPKKRWLDYVMNDMIEKEVDDAEESGRR